MYRAVASVVIGGDDSRGPRLRGVGNFHWLAKACIKRGLIVLEHRIAFCLFFLLNWKIYKIITIPVFASILEKIVSYVLSESKQLSKKLNVYHYIGCIFS